MYRYNYTYSIDFTVFHVKHFDALEAISAYLVSALVPIFKLMYTC